jgi:hypothetical protein
MENSTQYDLLVVEFQKGNQSLGAISIDKKDIDVLTNLHGQTIEQIAGDMTKSLLQAIENRENGESGTEG